MTSAVDGGVFSVARHLDGFECVSVSSVHETNFVLQDRILIYPNEILVLALLHYLSYNIVSLHH